LWNLYHLPWMLFCCSKMSVYSLRLCFLIDFGISKMVDSWEYMRVRSLASLELNCITYVTANITYSVLILIKINKCYKISGFTPLMVIFVSYFLRHNWIVFRSLFSDMFRQLRPTPLPLVLVFVFSLPK
jgi:hypothetical protein